MHKCKALWNWLMFEWVNKSNWKIEFKGSSKEIKAWKEEKRKDNTGRCKTNLTTQQKNYVIELQQANKLHWIWMKMIFYSINWIGAISLKRLTYRSFLTHSAKMLINDYRHPENCTRLHIDDHTAHIKYLKNRHPKFKVKGK